MNQTERKPLFLVLKRVYFNQILNGTKKHEYRAYSDYYISRLCNQRAGQITSFKNYHSVIFQEGYHPDARRITVEVKKTTLEDCFVIHLGNILNKNF